MDQMSVPETRRRSRSKTPFVLRSHCDKENCQETDHLHDGPVKKNPTVQTITEELEQTIPPVSVATSIAATTAAASVTTTSARVTRNTKTAAATAPQDKVVEITSSKSKTEVVMVSQTETSTVTTSAKTLVESLATNSTKERRVMSNAKLPTAEKSTRKLVQTSKEISQNELNREFEERTTLLTSTPIQDYSNRNLLGSAETNGDLSDHIAYKEYKEAGEYWNKYPKTDYTYSKLSPHRRELAPGVVAMPNMSRRSMDQHHERVNTMARSNPSQEAYIRARYQSSNYQQYQTNFQQENYYDSQDDEVDLAEWERSRSHDYTYSAVQKKSIIHRFITTITSTIYSIWYQLTSIFRRSETEFYYTRIEEEKGLLSKTATSISNGFLSMFRYVYLFISSMLFVDSLLLKSSNAENGNKKRFLLFLIILLPLLMLAGAYKYFDKPIYPSIVLDDVFNPIYLDNAKLFTLNQIDSAREITENIWSNVKIVSENSLNEMKNIWNENFGG